MREEPVVPGGAERADPDFSSTMVVGAIGVVLLLLTVVLLEVLYYRTADKEALQKVVLQEPQELRRLRAEQTELLNHYRWVDPARGVASIPIDRAMDLVSGELQARRAATGPGAGGPR